MMMKDVPLFLKKVHTHHCSTDVLQMCKNNYQSAICRTWRGTSSAKVVVLQQGSGSASHNVVTVFSHPVDNFFRHQPEEAESSLLHRQALRCSSQISTGHVWPVERPPLSAVFWTICRHLVPNMKSKTVTQKQHNMVLQLTVQQEVIFVSDLHGGCTGL